MSKHPECSPSLHGTKLAHWDLDQYCAWLMQTSCIVYKQMYVDQVYVPEADRGSCGSEPLATLKDRLRTAQEKEEIESVPVDGRHFAKPWEYSRWILKNLPISEIPSFPKPPFEDPNNPEAVALLLPRINLALEWGELQTEELLAKPTWTETEVKDIIWGRKTLKVMGSKQLEKMYEDDYGIASRFSEKLEAQRSMMEFVESSIPAELKPIEGGNAPQRFLQATVLKLCKKYGIPIAEQFMESMCHIEEARLPDRSVRQREVAQKLADKIGIKVGTAAQRVSYAVKKGRLKSTNNLILWSDALLWIDSQEPSGKREKSTEPSEKKTSPKSFIDKQLVVGIAETKSRTKKR